MLVPRRLASSCRIALAAGALALPLATVPARAEIIPAAEMLRGVTITRQQCAALPYSVWVESLGRRFCVRYYVSTAGGEGSRPVVFLQGDQFGKLKPKTKTFYERDKFIDSDTDKLQAFADRFSESAKTTAIYLARIGVDGTSGHHSARKTLLELHLMNAALDAIKQRHGYKGFHLVGQSGGSLLIGGIIGLRHDVGCAVSGSGPLSRAKPLAKPASAPLDYFDPADGIPQIAAQRTLRVLVVTDSADRKVAAARQKNFVKELREAGGRADQFFVKALDDNHHHVAVYARLAVADCVHGASSAQIASDLARLGAKRAAAAGR
jgi:hypothetical protein